MGKRSHKASKQCLKAVQFIDLTGPVAKTVKSTRSVAFQCQKVNFNSWQYEDLHGMFLCMLGHRCCIVGTLTELLKSETSKTLSFTTLF